MTDKLSPDERKLAERVAAKSSRVFARFWLAEILKVEEQIIDPAARWDILKRALALVGRRR